MKSVEELAEPLLEAIDEWKLPNQKIIIGLEGYSASGKTTLLNYVAEMRPDVLAVEVDDFLASARERAAVKNEPVRLEPDWRKAPWFRYEYFDRLLETYKTSDKLFTSTIYNRRSKEFNAEKVYDLSRPLLLGEGTFLLQSPLADRLDKLVYLDTPFELADKRRWERHMQKEPTPDRQKHLAWVERYMKVYGMYLATSRPKERADLVLQSVDNRP